MSSSAQNYRIKSLSERRKIYSRWVKNSRQSGSGCGSVGKAVASDTRVRGLNPVIGEVLLDIVNCQLYWKFENKEKEAENGPFFLKKGHLVIPMLRWIYPSKACAAWTLDGSASRFNFCSITAFCYNNSWARPYKQTVSNVCFGDFCWNSA